MKRPFFPALAVLFFALGCGTDITSPTLYTRFPITPSPEIATGNWVLIGSNTPAIIDNVYPIAGLEGALTVTDGRKVFGEFSIGSANGPGQPFATCLGYTFGLWASGTVQDGTLTLDADFPGNHMHITAQLSADRKSVASGSYTVTGNCATSAPSLIGYWVAPLTDTYTGQFHGSGNTTYKTTATLTQGDYFFGYGYVPVEGTITYAANNCTTTHQLYDAYDLGEISFLTGYTGTAGPSAGNNSLVTGTEDAASQQIAVDAWSFADGGCGAAQEMPGGIDYLIRQ